MVGRKKKPPDYRGEPMAHLRQPPLSQPWGEETAFANAQTRGGVQTEPARCPGCARGVVKAEREGFTTVLDFMREQSTQHGGNPDENRRATARESRETHGHEPSPLRFAREEPGDLRGAPSSVRRPSSKDGGRASRARSPFIVDRRAVAFCISARLAACRSVSISAVTRRPCPSTREEPCLRPRPATPPAGFRRRTLGFACRCGFDSQMAGCIRCARRSAFPSCRWQ